MIATFYTANIQLEHRIGLRGTVLKWFTSYLTNRTFSVMIGDFSSTIAPLTSGVPQGSILAPLLFYLYMSPLGSVISRHNVHFHFYADDIQIYVPLTLGDSGALILLQNCIRDIKLWLSQNFLHLNEDKTENTVFSPDSAAVVHSLGALAPACTGTVRNFGVILDSNFDFDKQIRSVVKTSIYHLRLLMKVKPFLSYADLEKAIHAFIILRLDYCNALYVGISQSLLRKLQLVQNAAAQLLSNTPKFAHITPVLRSLHWLPIQYRINFKILLFVFKAINGLAPPYISNLLSVYVPHRTLRSSEHLSLVVPRARCKKWGERSFAVYGPRLWNSLPPELQAETELAAFKSTLKTHLFRQAFGI
uniref:Reverse transcriptase domain-containing protein n=1 Tax=Monopterus albus TaxID=43700 RepID=A0A3Q3J5H2_MONAL